MSNLLSKHLIRQFTPMIKENIPTLEEQLSLLIDDVKLEEGESYRAIVLTQQNQHSQLTLCTFNDEDKLMRQIKNISLSDAIIQLLDGTFKL